MAASTVERIVREASQRDRVIGVRLVCDEDAGTEPWQAPPSRTGKPTIVGPLPECVELTLGDQIYIPKEAMPAALRNQLIRLAAFQNPEFYKAQAMRLSTYDKPRIIACAEELDQYIGLPRGCLEEVESLLSNLHSRHQGP